MKTSKQLFKENLRRIHSDSGLSNVDFAKKCGITRQSLHQYEAGETSPTLDILDRVCKNLGIPYGHFFGTSEPPPSIQALLKVPAELVSLWEKADDVQRQTAIAVLTGESEENQIRGRGDV